VGAINRSNFRRTDIETPASYEAPIYQNLCILCSYVPSGRQVLWKHENAVLTLKVRLMIQKAAYKIKGWAGLPQQPNVFVRSFFYLAIFHQFRFLINQHPKAIMRTLLAILIFSANFSNAQNLSNQLSACYPFEGNAQNFAPSGAVLNGMATGVTYTTGHTGTGSKSIHFAGDTNSHVQVASNVLIKPKQISVSGWFYADNVQDSYVIYASNNCSANDEAYSLVYKVNAFMAEIASGSSGCARTQVLSATVTPQTWYHVVFFIDTTIVQLYLNGVMSSQTHSLSWDYKPGAAVVLGNSLNPHLQSSFKGRVDNLRFYNRKLTQAEVTQLYTSDPACVESTVGIYDYQKNEFDVSIFPNPAIKQFEVRLSGNEDLFAIRVNDSSGRLVLEVRNENRVDVSGLEAGIYFVEIQNENGSTAVKKLIIE
jgi:hypothetical protein